MHGRLKVRTTQEQEDLKKKEREKKLEIYKHYMTKCITRIERSEFKEDGLALTENLLCVNPDLLSLWNLRRSIILALEKEKTQEILGKYYQNEISLSEQALKKNPKSYGSWLHRQWCLLRADNLKLEFLNWKHELAICNKYLSLDERNFHCWAHRQFVIKHGQISLVDELEYTHEKISSNFSNYSAWHYRSKLLRELLIEEKIDLDQFKNEISLIENAVFTDPNDQSAWIYQKWLLKEHLNSYIKQITLKESKVLIKFKTQVDLKNNLRIFDINGEDFVNRVNFESDDELGSTWQADIEANGLKLNETHVKIRLGIRQIGLFDLILSKNDSNYYDYKSPFQIKDLTLDNELMTTHLNNLKELSNLEDNLSKWCSLAIIELMCVLDYKSYRDEVLNLCDKLANQIDPYRRNFYIDYKNKIGELHD
jgi:geranylgeranyl transferase type-2 subunit alpha